MILLDRLVEFAPGRALCAVEIRPDSPFVDNGRLRSLVAIEYMAQAVAAYAGMLAHQAGRRPNLGFLLGTRELKLEVPELHAGDALEVEVVHQFGDSQLGSFRCAVRRGPEAVAQAVLTVYQRPGEGGFALP